VVISSVTLAACGSSTPPARSAVAPFVYAPDRHTGGISQFGSASSGSGALRALTPKTVASGRTPSAAAINPQGTSLYVLDEGTGRVTDEVTQYHINPATGRLTPRSHAATGSGAIWITVAPNGTSAYVADNYADAISQYRISPATGKLTPLSPATVKTPSPPGAIAVAPDGKYAYVADVTQGTAKNVLQYRINPTTGALSSKPVATVNGGPAAESITIAPDGKNAYVTDPIDSAVWQYRINPASGRLSLLSPATVPTGGGTHDLVIASDGKNAYVVRVNDHTVSQYRINATTGALSGRPASTASTVRAPELIVLAPDGKNAYVTGDIGGLSQYTINPATGKITPLSPATVTTPPGGSIGLAITPVGT
jgi:6-phosphogluconolactonase (cycloisomerase 2 family)